MNIQGLKTITLATECTQISFVVLESGHLALVYFGERLPDTDLSYVITEIKRASYLADTDGIKDFKLEQIPLVYPAFGNPDMRMPAHQESYPDGSCLSDFRYHYHEFSTEKEPLEGLPFAQHKEQQVLRIVLQDKLTKNELLLQITAFVKQDVFTQSVKYTNHLKEPIFLHSLMSLNIDFLTDKFDLLTLGGAWGRENQLSRRPIHQGFQGIDSKRGASGHGQNPFMALTAPETTEDSGQVIAANLIYSGNFSGKVEVDMHQNCRLQLGINPFEYGWKLNCREAFQTPESVFLTTEAGLTEMSHRFHRFFQECLIQSPYRTKERPILLNNWEATYFDFTRSKIIEMVDQACDLGIELFVLDDGWFGKRNDDTTSLGDWFENEEKLGGSLSSLVEEVHQRGLKFGIWVEPEMISLSSQLYEKHPDWLVQVPNRSPQMVRNQYVLDLTRREVQDYLIYTLNQLFAENQIDYVKWDMNRNITDSYSASLAPDQQAEFSHRYILGLYHILAAITSHNPKILFESCAGGGGRCDAGMLYYMPQTWISDDTDAIARLAIQEGTALVYPPVTMGCHVSAVPNHQVGRSTPLKTRALVAQQGNYGYELDILKLTAFERQQVKKQIQEYKKERATLQFGKHTRLAVYDPANEFAWQKENQQTGELIVTHITILARPNTVPKRLRLKNLEATARYLVNKKIHSGQELMKVGLMIDRPVNDFYATKWKIEKMEDSEHVDIEIG